MTSKLLLVDAYANIYRAFFAIRSLTGPAGQPVNAIFGFTKMLRKMIAEHAPTHVAVVFDLGAPRKRLAVLPSYKEQRPPTPPDLEQQLPAIRDLLAAWRLPVVEMEGEEADDIIATLATQAGMAVLIASNDKDFAQLVTNQIQLLRAGDKGDIVCGPEAIVAKYGVTPSQFIDYQSLLGDNVDNIPGVPGIGPKTAVELLRQFGSVDKLLKQAAEIVRPRIRELIVANAGQVRQTRQLVTLETKLGLPCTVAELKIQEPDYPRILDLLRGHGFKSLTTEFDKESQRGTDLFGGR